MASLWCWLGVSGLQGFEGCKIQSQLNNEQPQAAPTAFRHKAAQGQGNPAGRTVMEVLLCSAPWSPGGWWAAPPPGMSVLICLGGWRGQLGRVPGGTQDTGAQASGEIS